MRGRKPSPHNLKVISGNPSKRPLKEPLRVGGAPPRCPSWLSSEARKEWRRLAPELIRLGLLTVLDVAVFGAYCETFALFLAITKLVAKDGATYRTANGLIKRHPAAALAQQAGRDLLALDSCFGLTPAARQR